MAIIRQIDTPEYSLSKDWRPSTARDESISYRDSVTTDVPSKAQSNITEA